MIYLLIYIVIGLCIVSYLEYTVMMPDRPYTMLENYEWLFMLLGVLSWPYIVISYIYNKDSFGRPL